MSISFRQNVKSVELEELSNNDVIWYLTSKLNINNPHLKIAARPKFCNGIMAIYDDVYFVIHANRTYIRVGFYNFKSDSLFFSKLIFPSFPVLKSSKIILEAFSSSTFPPEIIAPLFLPISCITSYIF